MFCHNILAWERGGDTFRVHLSQKKGSSTIPGNVSINKSHPRHPFQEQMASVKQGIQNDIPLFLGPGRQEGGSQKCRLKGTYHSSSCLVNQSFHFFGYFYKILKRKYFIPRSKRMLCIVLINFLVFTSGWKTFLLFGLIHTKFISSIFTLWLPNSKAKPQPVRWKLMCFAPIPH